MSDPKYTRTSLEDMIPNNSDKAAREKGRTPAPNSKERQKKEAVVKGKVTTQKRSVWKRLKESVIGDDTQSVGDYMLHDVLIPAFKSTLSDMLGGGLEMLLFGERRRSNITRDRGRSYVSYGSYYSNDRDDRRDRDRDRDRKDDEYRSVSRQSRARHDFDDIIFNSRSEAELVLAHLVDQTIEYNRASVADFYDLSGIESNFTDDKYGWTNLRDAYTDRVRNGYIICFPTPRPLD
jgi:hypothetical protein